MIKKNENIRINYYNKTLSQYNNYIIISTNYIT